MDVQQFADIEAEFRAAEVNTLAYRNHELWHAYPGLAHTGLMPCNFPDTRTYSTIIGANAN